jgi:hypothetical protein
MDQQNSSFDGVQTDAGAVFRQFVRQIVRFSEDIPW